MTTVILAEKPSQAQAYASTFQHSKKQEGYFIVQDSLFSDETYVTFALGHLVELAEPGHYEERWKKWSLETLPIFPYKYDFLVAKGKKKQFDIVARLLQKATTIIIATDSDREGENIAWSIIKQAHAFSKEKTYQRLWINSMEQEVIYAGFQKLRDGFETYPYFQEAQTRQIADWLIGMTGSELYTLLLQQKGIRGVFSLGRVQTPTLYMIYQRQKEIEEFQKELYFEVEATIKATEGNFKGILSPRQRFTSKEFLESFVTSKQASLGLQEGIISNVEKKTKKTPSPRLFSLSSLQTKVNQLYKATASQTLKAVQGLYEKKLLSYPRTDTPYITGNEFNYLKANFVKYRNFLDSAIEMAEDRPRKRYVDGSKIQEHYAIIPTKQVATATAFEKMAPLEKKVYLLVLKTTLAMFLPDYEYQETIIETKVSELLFKATGKVPIKDGWRILFPESTKKEDGKVSPILPDVSVGEQVQVKLTSAQKETQPPKAFTEGTLLTAMKTAGKTLDDEEAVKILQEVEGIGTEATRASIIENLKQKEYIKAEKNKLVVTEKGQLLCQAVKSQPLLTSAEMTAKWETYLKKIGQRQGTQTAFLANIEKFIVHLLEEVPKDIEQVDFKSYEKQKQRETVKNVIGKCPNCGGDIVLKKSFYGCFNYPNCKFTLSNNFRKKKLTKTNVRDLLQGKETIVKSIKNKNGKTYNAKVKMNEKGYLDFIEFAK